MMLVAVVLQIILVVPQISCYALPRKELPPYSFAYHVRGSPASNPRFCGRIKSSQIMTITLADTRIWFKEPSTVSLTLEFKRSGGRLHKTFVGKNFVEKGTNVMYDTWEDKEQQKIFGRHNEQSNEDFFCVSPRFILKEEPPKRSTDKTTNGYYITYMDGSYDFVPYYYGDFRMPYAYIEGPTAVGTYEDKVNGKEGELLTAFPFQINQHPPYVWFKLKAFPTRFVRLCGKVKIGDNLRVTISDGDTQATSNVRLEIFHRTLDEKFRLITATGFTSPNSSFENQDHLRSQNSIFFDTPTNRERRFCMDMRTFARARHETAEEDQTGFFVYSRSTNFTYIPYRRGRYTEPFYVRIEGAQIATATTADDRSFQTNKKELPRVFVPHIRNAPEGDWRIDGETPPLRVLEHLNMVHELHFPLDEEEHMFQSMLKEKENFDQQ